MTTTKSYDFLNRLTSIASVGTGSTPSVDSYAYAYNDANQRTRVNMTDGSFWIYEYDKLGQVVSGKRYWSDWTPVAGQQYEYAFDDIGNRSSTKSGGDASGASLRLASYTANALNQYTSRDVPAYLNVLGIAHANASVTVNGQSPYRHGEYYRSEINSDNSVNPVWQAVTNIASLTGTNQTNTGNLFLPKTAESYTFDADGNLMSDGRWTNKWDGENRLIDMTSHSSGPSGSRKSLQFAYDAQGRRYSKVVSNWTGSAWTRALHELYLYDGWNLLGALDGTNNAIIRSFLWGLDLSGSLQGAGGVGGLICFKQHSGSSAGSHFAAYDGNGNVMALVDGKTGNTSARYEYDPFGQTIRASGMMAMLNPVRFSSKPVDDETDLAYYGYRYFNPITGRWLNRDPINETRGLNLFSFVKNVSLSSIDFRGLFSCDSVLRLATWIEELAYADQDEIGAFTTFFPGYPKMGINADYDACCPGDGMITEIVAEVKTEMVILQGFNWSDTGADGRSLEDHEGVHAANACGVAQAYEEALTPFLRVCLKERCLAYLDVWQNAYSQYLMREKDRKDAQFDCQGYGNVGSVGPRRCEDEVTAGNDARQLKRRADGFWDLFISCK